jgi:hypothetical protein
MEVSCQFHFRAALRPARNASTNLLRDWEGPRTGLDSFGGKKPLVAAAILTQDCPVRNLSLPTVLYTYSYKSERERGGGGEGGGKLFKVGRVIQCR